MHGEHTETASKEGPIDPSAVHDLCRRPRVDAAADHGDSGKYLLCSDAAFRAHVRSPAMLVDTRVRSADAYRAGPVSEVSGASTLSGHGSVAMPYVRTASLPSPRAFLSLRKSLRQDCDDSSVSEVATGSSGELYV